MMEQDLIINKKTTPRISSMFPD